MIRYHILFLIFLFPLIASAQKGQTTVGIQYKPIFPLNFIGTGKIIDQEEDVSFEIGLKSGFNAGVIVRHNFTNLLAFETGINYVKRKYSLNISAGNINEGSVFRIISYEIPALLMVYAQTGEKTYVNGSLGPVLDIFPSEVRTFSDDFNHVSFRNHRLQPAVAANVGFEYRTEESGNIYLGASFQRPFDFIYLSVIAFTRGTNVVESFNEITGNYLTIDLRYFFADKKPKNIYE